MIAALVLALGVGAAAPDTTGTLRGEVRGLPGDVPLSGATVRVTTGGEHRLVRTDGSGGYEAAGLAPGRASVRIRRIGYRSFTTEVLIPRGGVAHVDLALRIEPIALEGVRIDGAPRAAPGGTRAFPRPRATLVTGRVAELSGGLAGLGLGHHPADGTHPGDPADVLYVRGSAERQLVLLDGAPVYTPFHLAGLLEPFASAALASADLVLGGAPARYTGGLSYVMDVATRPAAEGRARGFASADPMAASASLEGSLTRNLTALLTGRSAHGLGLAPFVDEEFPYRYLDGLLRLDLDLPGEGRITATGFGNRERALLDGLPGDDASAAWANAAGSVRYAGPLGGADAVVTAAASGFRAEITGADTTGLTRGGERHQLRAAADLVRAFGERRLGYGASVDRIAVAREGSERSAAAAGAYLEGEAPIGPGLRLRAGLRADAFATASAAARLSPRAALSWLPTEATTVTLAAGRHHQLLPPGDSVRAAFTGADPGRFVVGGSTHTTLALEHRLDETLRLGVEAFFKAFDGADPGGRTYATASGFDAWLHRPVGRVRGWVGYSLSWTWAEEPAGGRAATFAGRHLVSLGGSADLGDATDLSVRAAYGAGLPYTAVPLAVASPEADRSGVARPASGLPPGPEPLFPDAGAFLRLDVTAERRFDAGRAGEIAPYLQLLNAFGREQALFYTVEGEPARARPVASVPVLPILGVRWTF